MECSISGKTAVVTGGTEGIGLAVARSLAREGCRVAICGRTEAKLERARTELEEAGATVLAAIADVSREPEADRLIELAAQRFGSVDILINNVGGSFGGGAFSESTVEQWRSVLDANVFSVLYMSKAAVPFMQARGWGRIVNIASIWGRESGGGAAYNAAKSAVVSMTKSMARDLVRHGILVNCVAPGSTWFEGGSWAKRTAENPAGMEDFVRRELPSGEFTKPEEVASAVTLLASELAGGVAGSCWVVDRAQGHSNL